jgi:hypothetical protein
MKSTIWGDAHMLPSRGVRVWVVCLTSKIDIVSLLAASRRVKRGPDAERYGLQKKIIINSRVLM